MMKKQILYLVILLLTLGSTGCKENEMELYSDTPALYFYNKEMDNLIVGQADSINQSFFIYGKEVENDTVWVTVNAMGFPEKTDRPIRIVQTNIGKNNAAVSGTHFVSFDDPKIKKYFCIPAGAVSQKIPIVCLRDKSLATGEYRLELSVEANEYFRPGIDVYRHFIVTTTDQAVKPNIWDTRWVYYFGASFGSEKLRLIIQSTGYTDFETLPSDYAYLTWLGGTAKQALVEYNAAHPDAPLCEADGTLVTFDN